MGSRVTLVCGALSASALLAVAQVPVAWPVRVVLAWIVVSVPVSLLLGRLAHQVSVDEGAVVDRVSSGRAVIRFAGSGLPIVPSVADESLLRVWARSAAPLRCDLDSEGLAVRLSRGELSLHAPLALVG